ncbi:MAG: hypothetical protein ACLPOO_01010 [Terriglobales bacterium]|jgi:predicted aspartyl protease
MPGPVKIGYLGANGHPHIKIKVWGLADQFAQEFEAMIDTGFTGFLSIPLTAAFPLALTLFGTMNYELADGSIQPKLLGFGTITLEDESVSGTILLESKGTGLLVGMEFLAKLNRALFVGKNTVWLVDETAIAGAGQTTTPTTPSAESAPAVGPTAEGAKSNDKGEETE